MKYSFHVERSIYKRKKCKIGVSYCRVRSSVEFLKIHTIQKILFLNRWLNFIGYFKYCDWTGSKLKVKFVKFLDEYLKNIKLEAWIFDQDREHDLHEICRVHVSV